MNNMNTSYASFDENDFDCSNQLQRKGVLVRPVKVNESKLSLFGTKSVLDSDESYSLSGTVVFFPQYFRSGVENLTWLNKLTESQRVLGLNVSQVSEAFNVSRMQYYNWLDESKNILPNSENLDAIDYLYGIATELSGVENVRLLGKLSKRKVFPENAGFIEALGNRFSIEKINAGIDILKADLAKLAIKDNKTGILTKKILDDDLTGNINV